MHIFLYLGIGLRAGGMEAQTFGNSDFGGQQEYFFLRSFHVFILFFF